MVTKQSIAIDFKTIPPIDIFALEYDLDLFQKYRLNAGLDVRKPNMLINNLND